MDSPGPTTAKIILDKNFVQGGKTATIVALCQGGRAVMPDALFYEMLTSPEPGRSRCFAKFPGVNPVSVVPNVGELLAFETAEYRPCGSPSSHAIGHDWKFNDALFDGTYRLPPEAEATLSEEDERLDTELANLVEMINMAPTLFAEVFASGADRDLERAKVEGALATETKGIVEFYSRLEPPDASIRPVPAELLTPGWLHFRWFQVKLWASLDLRLRLGTVDSDLEGARRHQLENYLHDMQYVMLALLEGGLATEDAWMRRAFRLFRPDGELVPSDAELVAKKAATKARHAGKTQDA
jgi:hypothetical protein